MAISPTDRIYIAGHRGMVGSALKRAFEERGCTDFVEASSTELDLRRQAETEAFVSDSRPDIMVIAAAKVGGIHANDTYPAEFAYDNLAIASNLIHAAHLANVQRLLFLGSSCIYPKLAEQPISEDSLLTGPLEPTNEAYAIAKIAGLKLCEYYRRQYDHRLYHAAMPSNLYGPGDNYHPENSHVIPALIRRFHEAKVAGNDQVTLWGTGTPLREFLHTDDLAAGVLHLLDLEDPPDLVNLGAGSDLTIRQLAEKIAATVGFTGELRQDLSRPDGTPRKLMDSSKINALGWQPGISLETGLTDAYRDFLTSLEGGTVRD